MPLPSRNVGSYWPSSPPRTGRGKSPRDGGVRLYQIIDDGDVVGVDATSSSGIRRFANDGSVHQQPTFGSAPASFGSAKALTQPRDHSYDSGAQFAGLARTIASRTRLTTLSAIDRRRSLPGYRGSPGCLCGGIPAFPRGLAASPVWHSRRSIRLVARYGRRGSMPSGINPSPDNHRTAPDYPVEGDVAVLRVRNALLLRQSPQQPDV
jgi:hypothetical protein